MTPTPNVRSPLCLGVGRRGETFAPARTYKSGMPARRLVLLAPLAALALALVPSPSRAEMWCADPLWAHEWGVVVFGSSRATRGAGPSLPAHFHRPGGTRTPSQGTPARDLAVDSGMRELPVLAFYTAGTWAPPVPIGLDVGFRDGEATRWFPDVDVHRTFADVTSATARAGRERLVQERGGRARGAPGGTTSRDPSRQLGWDLLELSDVPRHAVTRATEPWVRALRDVPRALWVNRTTASGGESERFVFYEGQTRETPALRVTRGPTWSATRRHLFLENTSGHPVHDVFLVHREAGHTYVLHVASIPAHAHAGYVLEDHDVAASGLRAATRDALRTSLIDPTETAAPTSSSWGGPAGCVMQRDPAIPFDRASDHRLYAAEIDVVLDAWGARFFDAQGTTLVYREDIAQLDAAMPLSIHTDMQHHVALRRLGLALVENVTLP